MAAESILTYKKPGFPKTSNSESGYTTTIEYVGPTATLAAAEPGARTAWGDYPGLVKSSTMEGEEGAAFSQLTVVVEYEYDSSAATGSAREVTTEIDWMPFLRPMLEHPEFRIGAAGTYALTSADYTAIEAWKAETNPATKAAYAYYDPDTNTSIELSTNAQKYAKGIELGQETYEDFAPVARKTTTYVLGPPSSTTAGLKDTPTGITGLPTGYEWRKSADRAIKAGGQRRWERHEEWIGAKKVLTDKDDIYW
jgi:hypothetical protein